MRPFSTSDQDNQLEQDRAEIAQRVEAYDAALRRVDIKLKLSLSLAESFLDEMRELVGDSRMLLAQGRALSVNEVARSSTEKEIEAAVIRLSEACKP